MAESLKHNWRSADGKIAARLEWPAQGELNISDFGAVNEKDRRKGFGRRALQELRPQYQLIRAIHIGDETNTNRLFWIQMKREGLVDWMCDFDGNVIEA